MLSKVSTIIQIIQILSGFGFFLIIKQKTINQMSYLEYNTFHMQSKDAASW